MIQYHSSEQVLVDDAEITCMLSEFVDGELLSEFVARHRGGRLPLFKALHLLHTLAAGLEPIHQMGEYHGDLHWENVLVRSRGIGFHVRLIDLYDWRDSKPQNIRLDMINMIRMFYDCIGGQKSTVSSHTSSKKSAVASAPLTSYASSVMLEPCASSLKPWNGTR